MTAWHAGLPIHITTTTTTITIITMMMMGDDDDGNDDSSELESWKVFGCRIQAYFFCSSAMVDPESLRTGLLMTMKPSSRTSRMWSLMLASDSFARSCLLLTLALPQTTPMTRYPIAAHDSITCSMKATVTTMTTARVLVNRLQVHAVPVSPLPVRVCVGAQQGGAVMA